MSEIEELTQAIREFANRRDWGVFHTPKNLAMAITGEAGELAAEFQWLTPEEAKNLSSQQLSDVGLEMADIAIYLLRLADVLEIDLYDYIKQKMTINETRFPNKA